MVKLNKNGPPRKPKRIQNTVVPEKARKRIQRMLPPLPKRATNGFAAFLKDYWASKKAENSSGPGSIQLAGLEWKALPANKKCVFYDAVKYDMKRYRQEKEVWNRQKAFLTRPVSSFGLFMKDVWVREKGKYSSLKDVARLAAAEWKALSEDQKRVYKEIYEKNKLIHQKAMEDFKNGQLKLDDLDKKFDEKEDTEE